MILGELLNCSVVLQNRDNHDGCVCHWVVVGIVCVNI